MKISDLEKKLKQPANVLLAKASSLGFTGSPTDELPQEIVDAIENGGGAKKLNAAPQPKSEPSGNKKQHQPRTEENLHAAFFASSHNLQQETNNTEILAAEVAGKLQANRIYAHFQGAKNQELMRLFGTAGDGVVEVHSQTVTEYQQDIQQQEHEAIAAYAHSDKSGKTLKQAAGEMKALLASFR
jgi:hypothetical protein